MRKILAVALLCGLGFISPGSAAAKGNKGSSSHSSHPSIHISVGRSIRFDRCHVVGRDCFRYYWADRGCYLYWYPGATCYYILTDAGLVPVAPGILPTGLPVTGLGLAGNPLLPGTGPLGPVGGMPPLPTGGAPTLPTGTPPAPPVDGAAPMTGMPR